MASEVEVEKLMTTLGVNTKDFEKGMKSAQEAVKDTQKVVESSGKELQGFYKELKELASATQSGIEAIGAEGFFKTLTTDVQLANAAIGDFAPSILAVTRPIESVGKSLGTYTNIFSQFRESLGDKGLIEKAQEMFTRLRTVSIAGFTAVTASIVTAAQTASTAILGSISAVTAAVAASPLFFVVAGAAIVTSIGLVIGAIFRLRKESESIQARVDRIKEAGEEELKGERKGFREDQENADTLRGKALIDANIKRLDKLEDAYETAEERYEKLKKIKDSMQFPFFFGITGTEKVLSGEIKKENDRLNQLDDEREKILEQLTSEPLRNIQGLHRGFTEELDTLGLRGEERNLRKIENQLKTLIDIRKKLVDEREYDADFDPRIEQMNVAIKKTTRELNRAKEALTELDQGRAVQATKDSFDHLNASLEGTIEKLQYAGDEWELYKIKRDAAERGAELGEFEEGEIRLLLITKKVLEERNKLSSLADQLSKRHATPTDKYRESMTDLLLAQRDDRVDETTFSKAAQEITKEFNRAERAIASAAAATTRFNAALVGSGEAAARMAEYQQKFDILKLVNAPPNIQLPERQRTGEEQYMDDLTKVMSEAIEEDEKEREEGRKDQYRSKTISNALPWAEDAVKAGNQNVVDKLQQLLEVLQILEENTESEDAEL